jgi:hypothetical protein
MKIQKTSTLFDKGLYRIVENPFEENAAVEILEGEYKGLVYQYGQVSFEDGEPQINFQRTIRKIPEDQDLDNLMKDESLNNLMGDILVELIQEQIRKENERDSTERTD